MTQAQLVHARADEIRPACPSPRYGADGTAGPLFCQAVDPTVLAFYQKAYPGLFKLGPDATPEHHHTRAPEHAPDRVRRLHPRPHAQPLVVCNPARPVLPNLT